MGKLFCLLGKSGSGKDTLYERILLRLPEQLQPVIGWTTRPMRQGERDGREYHFVTCEQMERMERRGQVLEKRAYQTVAGEWHYFTADFALGRRDRLMIATPSMLPPLRRHFGEAAVLAVYLDVPDNVRLRRALEREERQPSPRYEEICRRFLADQADFCAFLQQGRFERLDARLPVEQCVEEFVKLYGKHL